MDSTSKRPNGVKKAKLPRKRKKAAIKAQGAKWYRDAIKFYYIVGNLEGQWPKARFWDYSSIQTTVKVIRGAPYTVKEPKRYW